MARPKKQIPNVEIASPPAPDQITSTDASDSGVVTVCGYYEAVDVVPVYNGPRYDYSFLHPVGQANARWEENFKAKGKEGWEFKGTDSYGRSVFQRPL